MLGPHDAYLEHRSSEFRPSSPAPARRQNEYWRMEWQRLRSSNLVGKNLNQVRRALHDAVEISNEEFLELRKNAQWAFEEQ